MTIYITILLTQNHDKSKFVCGKQRYKYTKENINLQKQICAKAGAKTVWGTRK